MNWISDFVRPKIKKASPKEVADNLWTKCPECGQMLFNKDLEKDYFICSYCGHHLRLPLETRFKMLFDNGKYRQLNLPKVQDDPLNFKDTKRYIDRLIAYRRVTHNEDALAVTNGEIGGMKVLAVRDYLKGIRTCGGKEEPTGLPVSDVLYFELEKGCWVCVRPSGTEPKIKLYVNTKAATADASAELNKKLAESSQALMA